MKNIRPQEGAQTLFLSNSADIAICGGAAFGGKTFSLLLEAARHINNPRYQGIIFRRESVQITSPGGLRDTSLDVYPHLGGMYRAQPTPRWIFPSGAQITFAHLNNEDTVLNYQGSQMTLICYDELTHFSRFQFFYMLSRARSMSGIKPYIRASTNPDSDSWVAEFIKWWISEETGYPIQERSGVLRYLMRVNDNLVWGDSKEELMSQHGCDANDINSVTFVPSKATDNPLGLQADPSYIGRLKAMSRVERARLLDGNWKIKAIAGMYFPRFDATIVDWKPEESDVIKWVRSWDLAASEETEGRDPDHTVGLLVGRRSNGKVIIADMVRVRRKAADVRSLVLNLARKDGKETWVAIPRDPGQAGKEQAESYIKMLQGFTVISRSITRNKTTMAEPAAALWQQGNIEMVRAPWNDILLQELEQFPEGKHDDIVDCLSAAVVHLPGHAKPNYSQSGLNGRFKEVRSKRAIR